MRKLIIGCGDVGRRVVSVLLSQGVNESAIHGLVNSTQSQKRCAELGIPASIIDLDHLLEQSPNSHSFFNTAEGHLANAELYYTVAPQKEGLVDRRTTRTIEELNRLSLKPRKIVVISTTGVYGDCNGEWVTEENEARPQTERGQRRLDLERQWQLWGEENGVSVVVLRVPGIYSFSRLPRERIAKRTPVVSPEECGYTNRIHADDLARACVAAMSKAAAGEVFNATDGVPGKISEYLQVAAQALGEEPLPEISMSQAKQLLSQGMLSYLSESRKISNRKMLNQLGFKLQYPDFREGVKR